MNDEYLALTLLSHPGESEADFKRRLSGFWTHMLRNHPDDYEKVYAEMAAFETNDQQLSRKYLIEADVKKLLTEQLHLQRWTLRRSMRMRFIRNTKRLRRSGFGLNIEGQMHPQCTPNLG